MEKTVNQLEHDLLEIVNKKRLFLARFCCANPRRSFLVLHSTLYRSLSLEHTHPAVAIATIVVYLLLFVKQPP